MNIGTMAAYKPVSTQSRKVTQGEIQFLSQQGNQYEHAYTHARAHTHSLHINK